MDQEIEKLSKQIRRYECFGFFITITAALLIIFAYISTFAYHFSHSEFTDMQIFQMHFRKYWFSYVYLLIGRIAVQQFYENIKYIQGKIYRIKQDDSYKEK